MVEAPLREPFFLTLNISERSNPWWAQKFESSEATTANKILFPKLSKGVHSNSTLSRRVLFSEIITDVVGGVKPSKKYDKYQEYQYYSD